MKEVLKNEEMPVGIQIEELTKNELTDDDCVFYCLLNDIIKHPKYGDTIIWNDNEWLRKTIDYQFSVEFIRESLGKLKRESMIEVQFKHTPSNGKWWREISITSVSFYPIYFMEWMRCHSLEFKVFEHRLVDEKGEVVPIENVPLNLRIDIDNNEPLTHDDYLVMSILVNIEERSPNRSCGFKNPTLSKMSNSRYSDEFIFQSLGKLEREGIIKVSIYLFPPLEFSWRDIKIVNGFSNHEGVREWISRLPKISA